MYKYLQLGKMKRIEKSLLLLKIKRIEKSLLLLKIKRIEKSLLLLKIMLIKKSLLLLKNQAGWEIPAFAKNQTDWEILAFTKNQADWEILAFAKNQADWEILAGVEIPAYGEKPAFEEKQAELEKQTACLLFRLGGISSCWLLPVLADEHVQILVDVMNLAFSLQVRRSAQAALLLWAALSRTVPAVCTGPPCQKMAQIVTVAVQHQLLNSRPPNQRPSSRSTEAVSNCPNGVGREGAGQGEKGGGREGGRRPDESEMTPLIRSEGEGEEANSK